MSTITRRSLLAGAATAPLASLAATLPSGSVTSWFASVDVLVVGSGAAGTAAAIEAAQAGATVLVLEMLPKLGGSSAMSGGVVYCGGGTALQKACGIEDSVEAMRSYLLAASGLYAQQDKIDLYCRQSPEHFDWLVAHGVHYEPSFTEVKGLPGTVDSLYYSGSEQVREYAALARPAPRGHVPGHAGWTGGRSLMEALIPAAQRAGAKYLTGVTCRRLITESDGRVVGLEVEMDGKTRQLRAKRGVILAAGGFIHNREMLEVHAPELAQCSVPWGNMGDQGMGIQMGIAAGATTAQMHHGFAIMPLYLPDHVLKGVVVNRRGQRFIGEDHYHAFLGHQIAYHQGGQAWLIADKVSQYGYDDYRVREVARASSIGELERQLKLPERALVETVDYYNRNASKRSDPLFGKVADYLSPLRQAPFVAYDLSVDKAFFPAHTFGGLRTNTHSQVLNSWNEAIPGLYAAGRTSAGLPVAPYVASGVSVGDGTFFGRRAGKHATEAAV
ncbi:FAD-dependent oxidoreductase [Litorivivens sp.]|uniref:FAD-dependent oxidoreductase n=1 Tax=Litorivivens sp. TaxID=2020868 RepID=UPI003564AE85